MKIIKSLLALLCIGLITLPGLSWALIAAPGDTLLLTVVNHSDHILSYKSVSHTKTGNLFTLTSRDILPGARITIKATSTHWSGIAGDLLFEDSKGRKNILQIRDPLQIAMNQRAGTGTFDMSNPRLVSFVHSRKLNISNHPQSIAWTQATVEIQNRLEAKAV